MARHVVLPLVLIQVACSPAGAGPASAGASDSGDAGDSDSSGSAPTTDEPAGTPWARNFPIELDQIAVRDGGELVVSGNCYDRAIDGSQRSPPESSGICFAAVGPQGEIHWSRGFGGPTTSYAGGRSIAAGPDGGVFITGTFDGTIDLGRPPLVRGLRRPLQRDLGDRLRRRRRRLSRRHGLAAIRRAQRPEHEPLPRLPLPGRPLIQRTPPNRRTRIASNSVIAGLSLAGDHVLARTGDGELWYARAVFTRDAPREQLDRTGRMRGSRTARPPGRPPRPVPSNMSSAK